METNYDALIRFSAEELFQHMSAKEDDADMARIRDAFEFAWEAHSQQRRKSGEPYIIHPVSVARIVAEELELGPDPVIAAFLHDVVEDTDYTIEDIRDRFGDDVAFLVDVVTKKQGDNTIVHSKQIDNFRQILASLQYDVRALLIKLADRLHNMRTLSSMRPDKQMKIAGETDYFYAPLANRLGLYHIKTELENLSFRYRCPKEYALLEKMLEDEFENERPNIEALASNIEELLTAGGIKARTEVRYRKPYSIWMKMNTRGCDFAHIDSKYYVRVIYQNEAPWTEKDTSLRIYSILTDTFKERPGSVANFIDAPKENGYQSFQVKLLNKQGRWEELHISSERMVRNGRLGCAAERTDENIQAWLDKFNDLLKDVAEDDGADFMNDVTASFYYDDIMVFTPKGRAIILPKGATALDFAFEIHSDIGFHAHYARINGKLASVKTVLKRGDCIGIGTDGNAEPQADWLNHVLTYKARKYISSYLSKKPTNKYIRCTECHPLPGDEVIGFKNPDGSIQVHKRNCQTAIRLASQHGDSIVAIAFEENPDFLYPVRISVRAIDRYHLLSDLVECITEKLKLSMRGLRTDTVDHIGICTIDFAVHSTEELQTAMNSIAAIPGVDEVQRIDVQ